MTPELEQRLIHLSNTSKGLPLVRQMIDRGDFADPAERREVEAWLRKEEQRRHRAFLRTPEGSAIRQADYARTAIWISLVSLALSVVAIWVSLK